MELLLHCAVIPLHLDWLIRTFANVSIKTEFQVYSSLHVYSTTYIRCLARICWSNIYLNIFLNFSNRAEGLLNQVLLCIRFGLVTSFQDIDSGSEFSLEFNHNFVVMKKKSLDGKNVPIFDSLWWKFVIKSNLTENSIGPSLNNIDTFSWRHSL